MTLRKILPALLLAPLWLATPADAQATAPPQTLEDALHQLSDAAGIIFTGQVLAVRRSEADNGSSGVVEIDFRVDDAVRGCTAGSTYTLREWAGLWSGGDQRYRVGQRLLMLLHAPGAFGMSSPVGGMDGAIPIRGAATEIAPQPAATSTARVTATTLAATSAAASETTTPATPVADLRWIGTRVQRPIAYTASQQVVSATNTASPASSDVSQNSTAAQQAPVSTVMKMLASWQEMRNATP